MPKTVGRLTALKINQDLSAGMHADGAGLYLHVSASGAKSWIYRYSLHRKAREMGLGSLSARALAIVRDATALQIVDDAFIFRGGKRGKPLSNMAMAAVLKRMGRTEITVHGFRSIPRLGRRANKLSQPCG